MKALCTRFKPWITGQKYIFLFRNDLIPYAIRITYTNTTSNSPVYSVHHIRLISYLQRNLNPVKRHQCHTCNCVVIGICFLSLHQLPYTATQCARVTVCIMCAYANYSCNHIINECGTCELPVRHGTQPPQIPEDRCPSAGLLGRHDSRL